LPFFFSFDSGKNGQLISGTDKYGIVKHLKLFSLGKQLKVVADLQNSIKNQRF
jgi:hypothetical protein